MAVKTYVYILTVFIILNSFLDILLTLEGVSRFGIEAEGNPYVKNLLLNNQIWTWILFKVITSMILLLSIFIMIRVNNIKKIYFINYLVLTILLGAALRMFITNLEWIIYLNIP